MNARSIGDTVASLDAIARAGREPILVARAY
jgi:hypothetical protein